MVAALALLVLRPWAAERDAGDAVAWSTLGTADVHALAFNPGDESRLYFGHHGGLLESRDGGRSWQAATASGDAMNIRAGQGRVQIAGHEVYLESTDGGATWQPVPNDLPGLDLHAFAMDPGDPDHAWAFAAGFGLFETTDGGRHFTIRQSGNWGYLAAYREGDAAVLLAVGDQGLARSRDGGASWEPLAYPGAPLAGGLAAAEDGSAIYAATSAGLRRSSDGGASWQPTTFTRTVMAVAVAPAAPLEVAIVDDATRFYRSKDGGASWPGPDG